MTAVAAPATEAAPPARQRRPTRTQVWLAIVALASAAAFLLVRNSLIDDSYITLAYARNLAEHLHWGLIQAETANSATSPLNVILLALAATVTRVAGGSVHPVAGLGIVFVGCVLVVGWGLARVARALNLPFATAVVGTALVLVNPFVLSATGLEVHLIAAVLVALLVLAVEGRPVWFGAVSGLALLTRLDLVVFVFVFALATRALRRRLLPLVGAAAAVSVPWFVVSWVALGSAIPDTFVIKTLQHSFGDYTYGNGPLYYLDPKRWKATLVSFAPAVGGAVALLAWMPARLTGRLARFGPVASLGVGGVAYYGAYSALGVPPYQWYFVAPIVALSLVFAVALGVLARAVRGRAVALTVAAALAVAAVVPAAVLDLHGGARGVPWRWPPIVGNWATAADYARVGAAIGARVGTRTVSAPPEIGALAYFCDCAIVDPFSDQGRVVPLVRTRIDAASPVGRALLSANYLFLHWNHRPRPLDYQLEWSWTPVSGPDTWHLWSPATGDGYLRLVPVSGS